MKGNIVYASLSQGFPAPRIKFAGLAEVAKRQHWQVEMLDRVDEARFLCPTPR